MTYVANRSRPDIQQKFYVRINPKRVYSGWTLDSANLYKVNTDLYKTATLSIDGVVLTEFQSIPNASGWYHDQGSATLYVFSSVSLSSKMVVATYELLLAETDTALNLNPIDALSETMNWEGRLMSVPENKTSGSDNLFGFLPFQASSIEINNSDGKLFKICYSDSFSNARLRIYHCLGDAKPENIKEIFDSVCSDINGNDISLSIKILDRISVLDAAVSNVYLPSLTDTQPIRKVYGIVDGVRAAFVASDLFAVSQKIPVPGQTLYWMKCIESQVSHPSNTTTRTYLQAHNIRIGDDVVLTNYRSLNIDGEWEIPNTTPPGPPTPRREQVTVTAVVQAGTNPYIDHTAIPGGGVAMPATTFAWLPRVTRKVVFYLDGETYRQRPFDDYTVVEDTTLANDYYHTIKLRPHPINVGTPSGLPRYPNLNDTCFARVAGEHVLPKTSANVDFGAIDTETETFTNPIIILFDILVNQLKLPASSIDESTFATLAADGEYINTFKVGLCLPETINSKFPQAREAIASILASCFLRLFINDDGKWSLCKLGPQGSATLNADKYNIINGTMGFEFGYSEILSEVIVEYNQKEISDNPDQFEGTPDRVTATSKKANLFHGVKRQGTFKAPFFKTSSAQKLADRLAIIFGDRAGRLKFVTSLDIQEASLGEVAEVTREKLPSFEYDQGIVHTTKGTVLEVDKGLESVSYVLDDQKAIDENAGGW